MKVISLLQPWASLVVLGHKKIETRSWNTKYRGPLLIHASKNPKAVRDIQDSCLGELIEELYKLNMLTQDDYAYAYGAIIGKVNVVDTFRFEADALAQLQAYKAEENPFIPVREGGNDFEIEEEEETWFDNICKELAFGDYSPGRYGWSLSEPLIFDDPIPAKGSLNLWNCPADVMRLVEKQLKKT